MDVKNAILDKNENLYLCDKNGILYMLENKSYHPFQWELKNVTNCFKMMNIYFILDDYKILMFDRNFKRYNLENADEVFEAFNDVLKIEYDIQNNYIITLTLNNKIFLINISKKFNDIIARCYDLSNQLAENSIEFNNIKLCNDILFIDTEQYIYTASIVNEEKHNYLYPHHVEHNKCVINIDKLESCQSFVCIFNDGSCYDLKTFEYHPMIDVEHKVSKKNHYFYIIDQQLNIICKNTYNYVVEDFLNKLNNCNIISTVNDDLTSYNVTFDNFRILNIITSKKYQLIQIHDLFYLVNCNIKKLVIHPMKINFDEIISPIEKNALFVIDIVDNISIVSQIRKSISLFYRSNMTLKYGFNILNDNKEIRSYGRGTTREIFSRLNKELCLLLKNNFKEIEMHKMFELGNLFYFCNVESLCKFKNLHPYFYYLLSKESDHLLLLKYFKNDEYKRYKDLYMQYSLNPEKIDELCMDDIKTLDDYVKYLIANDLTDIEKEKYKKLYEGFIYFHSRVSFHGIVMKLPISYFIKILTLDETSYELNIKFPVREDTNYNLHCHFSNIITSKIALWNKKQIKNFRRNITGSNYNTGYIYIHHNIFGEQNGNIEYHISTCLSTLTLYCEIDEDIIDNILSNLTIYDDKIAD